MDAGSRLRLSYKAHNSIPACGKLLFMQKGNLRVLRWLGQVPAIGVCTFCNRECKAPMAALKRVSDAQESLKVQFAGHECKDINAQPSSKNLPVSDNRHGRSFVCFAMGGTGLLMPFSLHPFGYVKVPFGILYLQPLAIMAARLLQFS